MSTIPRLRAYPPVYPPPSPFKPGSIPGKEGPPKPFQSIFRWDLREDVAPSTKRQILNCFKADPIRRLPSGPPPDPLAWSRNITRIIMDVLAGRANVTNLRRWLEAPLYKQIEAQIRPDLHANKLSFPARIRCARLCSISEEIAEVALVIEEQEKHRAVALRLEAYRGRWMITALEIA